MSDDVPPSRLEHNPASQGEALKPGQPQAAGIQFRPRDSLASLLIPAVALLPRDQVSGGRAIPLRIGTQPHRTRPIAGQQGRNLILAAPGFEGGRNLGNVEVVLILGWTRVAIPHADRVPHLQQDQPDRREALRRWAEVKEVEGPFEQDRFSPLVASGLSERPRQKGPDALIPSTTQPQNGEDASHVCGIVSPREERISRRRVIGVEFPAESVNGEAADLVVGVSCQFAQCR